MFIYNFFQAATIVQLSGTVLVVRSVVLSIRVCGHLNVPVAATPSSQLVVLPPQAVNATFVIELKDTQFRNI